jgi:hypothetical protein
VKLTSSTAHTSPHDLETFSSSICIRNQPLIQQEPAHFSTLYLAFALSLVKEIDLAASWYVSRVVRDAESKKIDKIKQPRVLSARSRLTWSSLQAS